MTHQQRLIELAHRSLWCIPALTAARSIGLKTWCIGAGAIRNLVWDALHGYETPTPLTDIDVAYFDLANLSPARDAEIQNHLAAQCPDLVWDVTNQAAVHLWFEEAFGHAVAPLTSLDEAIASWPEYATAVGLTLRDDDTIAVLAPYGLDDLFSMIVRRNPVRVSIDTYRQRVEQKRYLQRWPQATVIV
jgi:uncharacterized protein